MHRNSVLPLLSSKRQSHNPHNLSSDYRSVPDFKLPRPSITKIRFQFVIFHFDSILGIAKFLDFFRVFWIRRRLKK
ncbi:hypothetical protein VNO78_32363 [Psophocarpus tetragonolobus]|uniref:Uncharacterized protein n=1 Tax=Psophocarpus tetragonolobus TaxID=3891 RepID=A0AAN9P0I0_PSOTE